MAPPPALASPAPAPARSASIHGMTMPRSASDTASIADLNPHAAHAPEALLNDTLHGHATVGLHRYFRHGMLPQLAALEAVVRFGSATRAAESLCIAQPTLSGHLRKLSEALGVRLFDLRSNRLVPTDAALVVLQAAGEVSAALARCEVRLSQQRRPAVERA